MRVNGVFQSKSFFLDLLHLASLAFTTLLVVLVVLTLLSRLGYLNLLGASVVVSHSMEPSIRCFDLVVYANVNYTVGDVIVYCVTPNHCVVHRVVGFLDLDTVNGNITMVVTKGDNVNETDSPVDPAWVRGRAIAVVPRELWVSLVLALLAYSAYRLLRQPVTGVASAVVLAVALASAVAVYATVPQPSLPTPVRVYLVNLAGVYLDPYSCSVVIRYTGDLSPTSALVVVNSTPVAGVSVGDREISFKPDPALLGEAFETGKPIVIEVSATLNHAGRLEGEYELRVGGLNPEVSPFNGVILLRNPNCFPVKLYVSTRYYDGEWRWSNTTYVVEGFSYLVVEPPGGVKYAYVYIRWFNQGVERWIGVPVRAE